MPNLVSYNAKICLTTVAMCIHDHKIMLVKHKKLGIWLAPGGHIEPGELPHKAAEREFLEETGLKVKAVNTGFTTTYPNQDDKYVPNPFASNLHWISPENYHKRLNEGEEYTPIAPWQRGCEQHLAFVYLVKLADNKTKFTQNTVETDDINWFTPKEVESLKNTTPSIKAEVKEAFRLSKAK